MSALPPILKSIADGVLRVLDYTGALGALDRSAAGGLTILMYHAVLRTGSSRIGSPAIDRDSLARHLRYLKRNCSVVHPREIGGPARVTDTPRRRRVALTFDDGFGNNATQAMPILDELRVPALFFVSTRHVATGEYLWFTHALALFAMYPGQRVELLRRTWELRDSRQRRRRFEEFVHLSRRASIGEIYSDLARYPVESFVPPDVIEDEMRGMTPAEIQAAARNHLFEIGAHTRDHPVLTTCPDEELDTQLAGGRDDILRITGAAPASFAYPEGRYDARVMEGVKRAGFRRAFAVELAPSTSSGPFTWGRVGVYGGGLGALAAKSRGLMRG